jgi:hypothetical protein
MTEGMTNETSAGAESATHWFIAAFIGIALLTLSIVIGGLINDGYLHSRDYVSALSSRGATAAWVGMTGLFGFSLANAAAGMAMRRHSTVAMVAFLAAAFAGIVTALARINCPGGAAHCSLDDSASEDSLDLIHGISVGAYQLFFLVGTLAAAITFLRVGSQLARAVGVVLIMAAIASAITVTSMPETHPGALQRIWLLINAASVLLVAGQAMRLAGAEIRKSERTVGP